PIGQAPQKSPPQSTPVSSPFRTPSVQVGHVIATPPVSTSLLPTAVTECFTLLPSPVAYCVHSVCCVASPWFLRISIAMTPFGPGGAVMSSPPRPSATTFATVPVLSAPTLTGVGPPGASAFLNLTVVLDAFAQVRGIGRIARL